MLRALLIIIFFILVILSLTNLYLFKGEYILLINAVLSLLLAFCVFYIFNSIDSFIKKMNSLLDKLISGDREVGIKYESRNEFNRISEFINKFLSNVREIERKGEERVYLSNKIIRALLRFSEHPIGILDSEKLRINLNAQKLFGVSWTEISLDFFLNHEENREFRELYKEIFLDKIDENERKIEIYFPSQQKKIPLLVRVATLKNESEEVKYGVVFFKEMQ